MSNEARVLRLRPAAGPSPAAAPARAPQEPRPVRTPHGPTGGRPTVKEPLWRDLVGDVLRRERLAQERTLKDVADAARISMPYLSELERGRKEASSEVLAAAAHALGLGLADLLSRAQGELVPRQPRFAPSRRPARTLAAPAESPSTSSTRTSGRPAESTHRTPLLDGRTLADAALVRLAQARSAGTRGHGRRTPSASPYDGMCLAA